MVMVQGASQGLGGGVGLADEDGEGGGDGVDGQGGFDCGS
jgi:hypothetical protein